jgi:hypothetical protein
MKRNRKPNPYPDEQQADLTFWSGDGSCRGCDALQTSTRLHGKQG